MMATVDEIEWVSKQHGNHKVRFPTFLQDPYVWGIVAEKTGFVEYLLESRKCLQDGYKNEDYGPDEFREMFLVGVAEAPEYSLTDVGWELKLMQQKSKKVFDPILRLTVGSATLEKIRAIAKRTTRPQVSRRILDALRSLT